MVERVSHPYPVSESLTTIPVVRHSIFISCPLVVVSCLLHLSGWNLVLIGFDLNSPSDTRLLQRFVIHCITLVPVLTFTFYWSLSASLLACFGQKILLNKKFYCESISKNLNRKIWATSTSGPKKSIK